MSEVLLAAIIGAAVGGALALLGPVVDHRISRRHQRKTLALSLRSEIEAIRTRFEEVIGGALQAVPPGGPLKQSIPIQENYFAVFDGSASMLRLLNTEDASLVISFYVDAKGLVDSLRCYENMLKETVEPSLGPRLREYTGKLKKSHAALSEGVDDLLRRLSKYGK